MEKYYSTTLSKLEKISVNKKSGELTCKLCSSCPNKKEFFEVDNDSLESTVYSVSPVHSEESP